MSNKVRDIDTKDRTFYFFNDIINVKKIDLSNIKIHKRSYRNILIYYIGYATIKDQKYVKINSANSLYLILNRYFEEIKKSKYLTLVATNENKGKNKIYEELWIKIRDLIRSKTKSSDDYDKKFGSDDDLPLTIIVRAVFHKNNKYYPQVFLDVCLYEL